jgi:small subunit ribosomal protein S17
VSKRLKGKVVSDKMNKTVMVSIERRVFHPLYKKIIREKTKLACHDEHGKAKLGDEVLIEETRPMSKTKHFRIVKIL